MNNTAIEWADMTWNPFVGCSKMSDGCAHCYAERRAGMLAKNPKLPTGTREKYMRVVRNGKWTGRVEFFPDRLEQPLKAWKPRRIFVGSMGDLFHEKMSFDFIAAVFGVMAGCPSHVFLLLTKRPWRAQEFFEWVSNREAQGKCLFPYDSSEWRIWQILYVKGRNAGVHLKPHHGGSWPLSNVWLGCTAENQEQADKRIPELLRIPAAKRFVSIEPMLGPVDFPRKALGQGSDCPECGYMVNVDEDGCCIGCGRDVMWYGINAVIVGGETGPDARPMHPDWVRSVRDQCQEAKVAFHFKSWGAWGIRTFHDMRTQCIRLSSNGRDDQTDPLSDGNAVWMERFGKRRSGHLLDGVEWRQWPDNK